MLNDAMIYSLQMEGYRAYAANAVARRLAVRDDDGHPTDIDGWPLVQGVGPFKGRTYRRNIFSPGNLVRVRPQVTA
jgi:hypothetical protein